MNAARDPLLDILRRQAEAAPEDVPSWIGMDLHAAFRQHHFRRRRWKAVQFAGLAACLLLSTVLVLRSARQALRPPVAQTQKTASTLLAVGPSADTLEARGIVNSGQAGSAQDRFVPLSTFDPNLPMGKLAVIRLELTSADLMFMGVSAGASDPQQRMKADVLVDEDGTPYAVRLAR